MHITESKRWELLGVVAFKLTTGYRQQSPLPAVHLPQLRCCTRYLGSMDQAAFATVSLVLRCCIGREKDRSTSVSFHFESVWR